MPELPEVETVRIGLEKNVLGWEIEKVEVLHPRGAANWSIAPLPQLKDHKIKAINRRGKFLYFDLGAPYFLVAHLGMSGQFLIDSQNAKHLRVAFHLKKGKKRKLLGFHDQRTFGWCGLSTEVNGIPEKVSNIAIDLFDPNFDFKITAQKIQLRKAAIKQIILNQNIVSGIGNIYADESLWLSKIHPETPACLLSTAEINKLLRNAKQIMERALKAGGTSFDALYINVNGESGYFAVKLNAYGRKGEPCRKCGELIIALEFGNRHSHICPNCQRPKTI
jgi:formamidopyrimidine-DNA glycosylase